MTNTGAIIMSVMATIWWLVGVRPAGEASLLTYGVPCVVSGLLVGVALWGGRGATPLPLDEEKRRGRLVGIASGVEGLAIFLAVNVLSNLGLRDYTAPVVAIIVGLHFAPLAQRLPARGYYVTGALLLLLGIAGFAIQRPDARLSLVSGGAAAILWLTSGAVLLQTRRVNRRGERAPAA